MLHKALIARAAVAALTGGGGGHGGAPGIVGHFASGLIGGHISAHVNGAFGGVPRAGVGDGHVRNMRRACFFWSGSHFLPNSFDEGVSADGCAERVASRGVDPTNCATGTDAVSRSFYLQRREVETTTFR
jgi:hypothetical protein